MDLLAERYGWSYVLSRSPPTPHSPPPDFVANVIEFVVVLIRYACQGQVISAASLMATALKSFLNSPVGPKTTHFWGPVANWGFVIAVRLCSSCLGSYAYAKSVRSAFRGL